MRGQDQSNSSRFGYVEHESRVPAKHLLRMRRVIEGVTPQAVQNTHEAGRPIGFDFSQYHSQKTVDMCAPPNFVVHSIDDEGPHYDD